MANLLSQGTGIFINNLTASPVAFEEIGQVMTISGPDGSASEIDVTNLASAAKEFVIGLPDEGSVQLSCSFDYNASPSINHDTLHAARVSQILQTFEIRLSDSPATVIAFSAYVTGFSLSLGVDDKVGANFTLRITGAATIT